MEEKPRPGSAAVEGHEVRDILLQKGRPRVWRAASEQERAVSGRRDEGEENGSRSLTLLESELPVSKQKKHC